MLMLLLLMILIPTLTAVAVWRETRAALEPARGGAERAAEGPIPERLS